MAVWATGPCLPFIDVSSIAPDDPKRVTAAHHVAAWPSVAVTRKGRIVQATRRSRPVQRRCNAW